MPERFVFLISGTVSCEFPVLKRLKLPGLKLLTLFSHGGTVSRKTFALAVSWTQKLNVIITGNTELCNITLYHLSLYVVLIFGGQKCKLCVWMCIFSGGAGESSWYSCGSIQNRLQASWTSHTASSSWCCQRSIVCIQFNDIRHYFRRQKHTYVGRYCIYITVGMVVKFLGYEVNGFGWRLLQLH